MYKLYSSDAPLLVRRLLTCDAAPAAASLARMQPVPAALAQEVSL